MMRSLTIALGTLLLLPAFTACEKDITLDLPQPEELLVVEGRVASGNFPYLLLTRNMSFFAGGGLNGLDGLFVHDADVAVTVNGQRFQMTEYCLNTLPAQLRPLVLAYLGISEADALSADVCAYISFDLTGEFGKRYNLEVEHGIHSLTATTSIPHVPPIDSMWYIQDADIDSLVVLWVRMWEPDTLGNFYRYFTRRNSEPFYPGYFGSVWDDRIVNGQRFSFNLDRGYPRNVQLDFSTFGKFVRGDTIILNINMIDRAVYDFWNTLEEQQRTGGPFASPTYIRSNIKGGLGIWGGYGAVFDTLVVPK